MPLKAPSSVLHRSHEKHAISPTPVRSLTALLLALLPATAVGHENYQFSCALQDVKRNIEVAYLVAEQAVPCEVRYQKNSAQGVVLWRANNQVGFCEAKAQTLLREHKAIGFECKTNGHPQQPPKLGQY